jgi:hypothetical protein
MMVYHYTLWHYTHWSMGYSLSIIIKMAATPPAGVLAQARCCEGTQHELICREAEVGWDKFCIAETDELFDGACIASECR